MTTTRIHLLGGVNVIGGNKFLIEEGGRRVLLDFGTDIGTRSGFFDGYLGVRSKVGLRDLLRLHLLPHVDGVYRRDLLEAARGPHEADLPEPYDPDNPGVDAILLTHAHMDHVQDLSFVDPRVPVHMTPTTRALVETVDALTGSGVEGEVVEARVLEEAPYTGSYPGDTQLNHEPVPRDLRDLQEGRVQDVAGFDVTPVPVDHSVPGACALHLETPAGRTIFYTGDVRFHGRLSERTEHLLDHTGSLQPDVMLCEGTRIDATGGDDEAAAERGVQNLAEGTDGLAVAEFGWKDTTRFDTLERVAEATDRTLLVSHKLAHVLHALHTHPDVPSERIEHYDHVEVYNARKGSYLPDGVHYNYSKERLGYHPNAGVSDRVDLDGGHAFWERGVWARDVRDAPEEYLVHLSFWEMNELHDLTPPKGSRWIRCLTEPYSDEMALDIDRQRRWLQRFGMDHNLPSTRKHPRPGSLVGATTHVSGHADGASLKDLVRRVDPQVLVPIHVEGKHLDHFQGLAGKVEVFPDAGHATVARGGCVVEVG